MKHVYHDRNTVDRSCSCTSCLYASGSEHPTVKKIIAEGSRLDELYLGKYLPLREKNLLCKLMKTREVFEDVRNQLICDNIKGRKKRKITPSDLIGLSDDERYSIFSSMDFMDNIGEICKLKSSECCNCCRCASEINLRKGFSKETERGNSVKLYSKSSMYSTNTMPVKVRKQIVRHRTKHIQSDPCTCTTLKFYKLRQARSKRMKGRPPHPEPVVEPYSALNKDNQPKVQKGKIIRHKISQELRRSKTNFMQTNEVPNDYFIPDILSKDLLEKKGRIGKYKRKNVRKYYQDKKNQIINSISNDTTNTFQIRKDSIAKFKEDIVKKRKYRLLPCDSKICVQTECLPENCDKRLEDIKLINKYKKPSITPQISKYTKFNKSNTKTGPRKTRLGNKSTESNVTRILKKPRKRNTSNCYNILPDECEPYTCVPDKCDPMKCVKKIHRSLGTQRILKLKENKFIETLSKNKIRNLDSESYTLPYECAPEFCVHSQSNIEDSNSEIQNLHIKRSKLKQNSHKVQCECELLKNKRRSRKRNNLTQANKYKYVTSSSNVGLYECEPNMCIPSECDPRKCQIKRKKRLMINRQLQHHEPRQSKSIRREAQFDNNLNKLRYRSKNEYVTDMKRYPKTIQESSRSPSRILKINSNFNFDLQFLKGIPIENRFQKQDYKDVEYKYISNKNKNTSQSSQVDNKRHEYTFKDVKTVDKGNYMNPIPRSCFCTLKLHKPGSKFRNQMGHDMSDMKTETSDEFFNDKVKTFNKGNEYHNKYLHREKKSIGTGSRPKKHKHTSKLHPKSNYNYTNTKLQTRNNFNEELNALHTNKTSPEAIKMDSSFSFNLEFSKKYSPLKDMTQYENIIENIHTSDKSFSQMNTNKRYETNTTHIHPWIKKCFCTLKLFEKDNHHGNKTSFEVYTISKLLEGRKRNNLIKSYSHTNNFEQNITSNLLTLYSNDYTKSVVEFCRYKKVITKSCPFKYKDMQNYFCENWMDIDVKDKTNFNTNELDTKKLVCSESYLCNKKVSRPYLEVALNNNNKLSSFNTLFIYKSNQKFLTTGLNPFLKRCFCTMNIRMSQLKPYECEPNICIPGECDPIECQKRIFDRLQRTKFVGKRNIEMRSKRAESSIANYRNRKSQVISNQRINKGMNATRRVNRCFCTLKLQKIGRLQKKNKEKLHVKKNYASQRPAHPDTSLVTLKNASSDTIHNNFNTKFTPNYATTEAKNQSVNISQLSYNKKSFVRLGKIYKCLCADTTHKIKTTKNINPRYTTSTTSSTNTSDTSKARRTKSNTQLPNKNLPVKKGSQINFNNDNTEDTYGLNKKSSERQAVRIGSKISVNIEFFKDEPIGIPNDHNTVIDDDVTKLYLKEKKIQHEKNIPVMTSDTQTISGKFKNTMLNVKPLLKRCFCTLTLKQRYKGVNTVAKRVSDMGVEKNYNDNINLTAKNTQTNLPTKRNQQNIATMKPYECEPGICIPGECDPFNCETIIRKRQMRHQITNSEWPRYKSKSTSSIDLKRKSEPVHRRQRINDISSNLIPTENIPLSSKQALKVSSSFSFKVELVKDNLLDNNTDYPLNTIKKPFVLNKASRIQTLSKNVMTKMRALRPVLQRCFCTYALRKNKNVNTTTHHDNMNKGIKVSSDNQLSKQSTQTLIDTMTLGTYECEPGVCSPGYCNPYECEKLIKIRRQIPTHNFGMCTNKLRSICSTTSSPCYKHKKMQFHHTENEPCNTSLRRYERDAEQKFYPTTKVKRRERNIPSGYPSEQVVRIASTFSFDIGFFKENHTDQEVHLDNMNDNSKSQIHNIYMRKKAHRHSQTRTGIGGHRRKTNTNYINKYTKNHNTNRNIVDVGIKPKANKYLPRNTQTCPMNCNVSSEYYNGEIKKPLINRGSESFGRKYKTKSVGSMIQMPNIKHRKFCNKQPFSHGYSKRHNRNKKYYHNEQDEQVVKIGSSFSFNIEFFKEQKDDCADFLDYSAQMRPMRKYRTSRPVHGKNKKTMYESSSIRNLISRNQSQDTQTLHDVFIRPDMTTQMLDPFECEPGICVSTACNPLECEKRIKKRNYNSYVRPKQHKTKSAYCMASPVSCNNKKFQYTSSHPKYYESVTNPKPVKKIRCNKVCDEENCRDVSFDQLFKIESNFNFKLGIYKDGSPGGDSAALDHEFKKDQRSKRNKNFIKANAFQNNRPLHQTCSETQTYDNTTSFLKRCFCTLAFLKRKNKKTNIEKKYIDAGENERSDSRETQTINYDQIKPQIANALSQYECATGICVPGECDPYECEGIMKRLNTGISTEYDRKSKSVYSMTNNYTPIKTKKIQYHNTSPICKSTYKKYENCKRNVLNNMPFDQSTKQAVRIGSNFNFKVEFAKGNQMIDSDEIKNCANDNDYLNPTRERENKRYYKQNSVGSTKLLPLLRRCFCTLGLQKNLKNMPVVVRQKSINTDYHISSKDKKRRVPNNHMVNNTTNTKKRKSHLKNTGTRPRKRHSNLYNNSYERNRSSIIPYAGLSIPYEKKNRRLRKCYPVEMQPHVIPECDSNCQAVRIGSSFNFNIEFCKGKKPCIPEPCVKPIVQSKTKKCSRPSQIKRNKNKYLQVKNKKRRTVGLGNYDDYDDENTQAPINRKNRSTTGWNRNNNQMSQIDPKTYRNKQDGISPFYNHCDSQIEPKIRRPFTNQFGDSNYDEGSQMYPKRKKDAGVVGDFYDQHRLSQIEPEIDSRGAGTTDEKCFCATKLQTIGEYIKEAAAGTDSLPKVHKVNKKNFTDFMDILPYECEIGTCIPDECDPYECLERIKHRFKSQGMKTQSKIFSQASANTKNPYFKSKGLKTSKRRQFKQPNDSYKSYPSECTRKNKQAVNLGSSFSFNIEFFKDNNCLPDEQNLNQPVLPCSSRDHKSQIDRSQNCNKTVGVKHLVKRCFCTLKLRNEILNKNANFNKRYWVQYHTAHFKSFQNPPMMSAAGDYRYNNKAVGTKIRQKPIGLNTYCEPGTSFSGKCVKKEYDRKNKYRNFSRSYHNGYNDVETIYPYRRKKFKKHPSRDICFDKYNPEFRKYRQKNCPCRKGYVECDKFKCQEGFLVDDTEIKNKKRKSLLKTKTSGVIDKYKQHKTRINMEKEQTSKIKSLLSTHLKNPQKKIDKSKPTRTNNESTHVHKTAKKRKQSDEIPKRTPVMPKSNNRNKYIPSNSFQTQTTERRQSSNRQNRNRPKKNIRDSRNSDSYPQNYSNNYMTYNDTYENGNNKLGRHKSSHKKDTLSKEELDHKKIKLKEDIITRRKRHQIYSKADEKLMERRNKIDKKKNKKISQYKKYTNQQLVLDSVADAATFGCRVLSDMTRITFRRILHPKDYFGPKDQFPVKALKDQKKQLNVYNTCVSAGGAETLYRLRKRFDALTIIKETWIKIGAFRASRRRRTNAACSVFLASLRKRPFLWVYDLCPWFYPHCLSLVNAWRQFCDIMLLLTAIVVWCPCIICIELCRAILCCFIL